MVWNQSETLFSPVYCFHQIHTNTKSKETMKAKSHMRWLIRWDWLSKVNRFIREYHFWIFDQRRSDHLFVVQDLMSDQNERITSYRMFTWRTVRFRHFFAWTQSFRRDDERMRERKRRKRTEGNSLICINFYDLLIFIANFLLLSIVCAMPSSQKSNLGQLNYSARVSEFIITKNTFTRAPKRQ